MNNLKFNKWGFVPILYWALVFLTVCFLVYTNTFKNILIIFNENIKNETIWLFNYAFIGGFSALAMRVHIHLWKKFGIIW
ncbi:hypothetical protein ACL7TT_07050 [Microbulbifer sp. 2304DJ12-6]|uniref:hypothetical protein n=1 Tax=Microbulbifer sp. 2304DJ12-6 TaxID=3233340 RepID=UPI0039AEEF6C